MEGGRQAGRQGGTDRWKGEGEERVVCRVEGECVD